MPHDQTNIYNLDIAQTLEQYKTQRTGLTDDEAAVRVAQYGPNSLTTKKPSLLKRLIEPFANAFVAVLLVALLISVYEGEHLDAIIIGVIVGVNAIIYYAQQYSVGRVLQSLREVDVAYVHVVRQGESRRIPSEQLTYGDVIHIEEGDKIPADGRLIEASQVQADESLLTGESLPVHKHAGALNGILEVYDQKNMLFKGTYVKSGTGLMVVTSIGDKTQLGTISALAGKADHGKSPIERKIDDFTKKLIMVVVPAAAFALALAMYRGIAPEEAVRFALVVAVSAVPEGLPVALTIVLLLSARRMARVKALVKNIASIETMGAITLIATDKTGTLTKNKLSVVERRATHADGERFARDVLTSLNIDLADDHAADSLDRILADSCGDVRVPDAWEKVRSYPFNQSLRMSGVAWSDGRGSFVVSIKGAPEQILAHCQAHHHSAGVAAALRDATSKGYRTIAFAHKTFHEAPHALDADVLHDFDFDGFVSLSDELRDDVKDAVQQAHQAGIRVVMLTGDHIATAGYIAQRVGIATSDDQVRDSGVLDTGSEEDIREALKTTRVFGRVLPEHKYALLRATKGHEITAMTGDGVNDIPALVEADTGLAMGSGTDAAKDASDIVLLDDNFHTIVNAIRIGRTALANIRKMLMYLLGTTAGGVLTLLSALLLGLPLPIVAIQILWINLVTDGVSVIPLGLSKSEPRHMQQPPQAPNAPLLNMRQVTRIIIMAVAMSSTVLVIFNHNLSHGQQYAQTLAFLGLIVVQWANAFNVHYEYKSWLYNFVRPNWKLVAAIAASIGLNIVMFTTPLGGFLEVVPVEWTDALVAALLPALVSLIAVDLHKFVCSRMSR